MSTSDTPEPDSSEGFARRWASYDGFSVFTTFFGFIADLISVGTVVFAIRIDAPSGFNAYHALLVWCVLVFLYVCFLHVYWRRKRRELDDISFTKFLSSYVPGNSLYLYVPLFIALLVLVWILAAIWLGLTIEDQSGLMGLLCIPLFIAGAMILAALDTWIPASNRKKFNNDLSDDWSKWDKLVTERLKGYQWIGASSFRDVQKEYGVGPGEIEKLLAKYAMRHPRAVRYVRVIDKANNKYLHDAPVLVRVKELDESQYTY